jgi:hypothetical protein
MSNPVVVTGAAGAKATIRLYVNGKPQQTTTASSSGSFSFNAELFDGNNVLHAMALSGADKGDRSNTVEVVYNNAVPRTQSGTISGAVVWTPGSPVKAYTISENLTIAGGAKLVLQPGTILKFASGTSITAAGALKVAGTAGNPVTLKCSAATPTRGCWQGVKIRARASVSISNALIEWAVRSIEAASGAGYTLSGSTVRNFSESGLYFAGTTSATQISGSTIDNLNDAGTCVYMYGAGTPTIQRSVIANCGYGFYLTGDRGQGPRPQVSAGNQILSHAPYSVWTERYQIHSKVTLNFTDNWWGTPDTVAIATSISDLTDSPTSNTLPAVNFGKPLSGPGVSDILFSL